MNNDGEAIASPFVVCHPGCDLYPPRGPTPGGSGRDLAVSRGDLHECCDPKEDQALWRSFGSNIATYLFDNSCAIRAHT